MIEILSLHIQYHQGHPYQQWGLQRDGQVFHVQNIFQKATKAFDEQKELQEIIK